MIPTEILRAVRETPRRIADAWLDPVRRRHSISRIAESYLPALAILLILGHGWASVGWAAAITLGEFAVYEYALEPLGITSAYWERPPREGERFVRP